MPSPKDQSSAANPASRRKAPAKGPKYPGPPARQGPDGAGRRVGWISATLAYGLAGSLLAAAALPPLGLWPIAWLAPAPWLWLVRQERLPGKRPYRALWLAGYGYWLLVLHWLRLPHPATAMGWLALSAYLACYLPAFVGLARVAAHQWRWPLWVAAPLVWVGLELVQNRLMTGFGMGLLGHSQFQWLALIQVADLAGAYAISALLMVSAGCLASLPPLGGRGWRLTPLVPLVVAVAAALAYGHARLGHPAWRPGPRIALIQGSIDTEVKSDPRQSEKVYEEYYRLSETAVRQNPRLDLIVWPETMFRDSLVTYEPDATPPPGWGPTQDDFHEQVAARSSYIGQQARWLGAPLLLGIDTARVTGSTTLRYNSALYVDAQGQLGPRYDKMHPVMFGEYIPFGKVIPWLYQITPIGAGIQPGVDLPVFQAGEARLAANICYESTQAHLIRYQVARLRSEGQEPDILVNLTNDGWFWGSSELDLHLICGVFRAVECRKPFLIAANTGFSAWIDADGRIVRQGPRRDRAVIDTKAELDDRLSPYTVTGDLPAVGCFAVCAALALAGIWRRRAMRRAGEQNTT